MRVVGWLSLCVLWAAAPSSVASQSASFEIIVNERNPTLEMTATELSRIFLKRSAKWNDGTEIEPVDQSIENSVRDVFSKEIHGKGASAIRNYWQRQIYSGRSVPPIEMVSDDEVLRYVRENAGAIGYVRRRPQNDGVRIIRIAR